MGTLTVQCHEVSKAFGTFSAVQGVSFDVVKGEIVTLVGPSGCGKTTLLRLIAGFEHADSGTIAVQGRVVAKNGLHVPPEKRRVGMVFQDYAIFPHLSVLDNVRFGLKRGQKGREKALAMLALVGLGDSADKMPQELSGGQQQRVAIARALAPDPAMLLLDEPFSNLDANLRYQVRREVRDLLTSQGITAIFVTHDQEEALYLGNKIAVMHAGKIVQFGTPEDVFGTPQTQFVAEFLGNSDFVLGKVATSGAIDTPLGKVYQETGLSAETYVQLAVRTDDILLTVAGESNATIVDRRYTGTDNIYTIRLKDGSEIHSRQPHTLHFKRNTPIHAMFTADHPIPCFHEGVAV